MPPETLQKTKTRSEIRITDLQESEEYADQLFQKQEEQRESYRQRRETFVQTEGAPEFSEVFMPKEIRQVEAPQIVQKAPKDMSRKDRKKYEQQQAMDAQILAAFEQTRSNKAAVENERDTEKALGQSHLDIQQIEEEIESDASKNKKEIEELESKIKSIKESIEKLGTVEDSDVEKQESLNKLTQEKTDAENAIQKIEATALEKQNKLKKMRLQKEADAQKRILQEAAAKDAVPGLLQFSLTDPEISDKFDTSGEKIHDMLTAVNKLERSGLLESDSKLLTAYTKAEIERLQYMISPEFRIACSSLMAEKMLDKSGPITEETLKGAKSALAKIHAISLAGRIQERMALQLPVAATEQESAMDTALKEHPDVWIGEGVLVLPELIPQIERIQKLSEGPHYLYEEENKLDSINGEALELAKNAGHLGARYRAITKILGDMRQENANDLELRAQSDILGAYEKKIKALTWRMAVLEECAKFIHEGTALSYAGKQYLNEIHFDFEPLKNKAEANSYIYADLFAEKQQAFDVALADVDWSRYEMGSKEQYIGSVYHSRAVVLMKTEGGLAGDIRKENRGIIERMILISLYGTEQEGEVQDENFSGIKDLLRPMVWKIMSMDVKAYLAMSDYELADHQNELQDAVLANMFVSDLGKAKTQIKQQNGTTKTLSAKEMVFGMENPAEESEGRQMLKEYNTRSTVLNLLSEIARFSALQQAAKLGVSGFEMRAIRDVEQGRFQNSEGGYQVAAYTNDRLASLHKNLATLTGGLLKSNTESIRETTMRLSTKEMMAESARRQSRFETGIHEDLAIRHQYLYNKYGVELESVSAEEIRDHYLELMEDLNSGMTESELTSLVQKFAGEDPVLCGRIQYYNSMSALVTGVFSQYASSGGNVDEKTLNTLYAGLRGDIETARALMGMPSLHAVRWGTARGER